jgi:hypothetical protein
MENQVSIGCPFVRLKQQFRKIIESRKLDPEKRVGAAGLAPN